MSRFKTLTDTQGTPTGCWDSIYNQPAPMCFCSTAGCGGSYQGQLQVDYLRTNPIRKKATANTPMRNFIGEGIVNKVKSNPLPMIAFGVAGAVLVPWAAKQAKVEWFGKANKAVMIIGGIAIGLAVGGAISIGTAKAQVNTASTADQYEPDPTSQISG